MPAFVFCPGARVPSYDIGLAFNSMLRLIGLGVGTAGAAPC